MLNDLINFHAMVKKREQRLYKYTKIQKKKENMKRKT